eukprot:TRINITY_DN66227_c6_g3_i2.p1 TRINITY_DN66227_c6_g3~~TRINITY_DN66227_c6_g3_i2.p1  ORF type:complete len:209 (-),score=104.04 TRINITY_DN66227_c6_g3_i2:356-982(-)
MMAELKTPDVEARRALKVLVVGCGNSPMSKHMYEDGFEDMTSIDYSDVVIEKMRQTDPDNKYNFMSMDVRKLKFPDAHFDLIVDKGTLDAILCGSDSSRNAGMMLAECKRVLKPGGFFFVITYGVPESRLNYLKQPQRYQWTISHTIVGKTRHMYTMLLPTSSSSSSSASSSSSESKTNGNSSSSSSSSSKKNKSSTQLSAGKKRHDK